MISEKLFRDPVHDLIILDRDDAEDRVLLAAIDSAEVQRLRRIKQLGMAHVAYQGAEHSRFTHSIGVMHLLRRMLGRLTRESPVDPLWKLATMCAGLLHDLGHGPFSHVMEKFFKTHHEEWTRRVILDPGTEIHQVLARYSAELPAAIVAVLTGGGSPRWLTALISSQLDADRLDYLLRDSHMTGVKYGIFDLERLLLLMRVSADGANVVIDAKGVLPVEKYLQSRYQMYRQVYFHKTVTAAEAMLMMVLSRARDLAAEGELEGVAEDSPLGRVLAGRSDVTVEEYLALDDSVLLSAMNGWMRGSDTVLADLSRRLLTRGIFKAVEVSGQDEGDILFGARINEAREYLAGVGLDWRYYLTFSKSADTPYRPYSPRGGSSTIWIQDAKDPAMLRDIKDVSPTIKAFTESPYAIHRAFFPAEADGRDIRGDMTRILSD